MGYQISVNIENHHRNMTGHQTVDGAYVDLPVMVLQEIVDEAPVSRRDVFEVHILGPSRSEYGWGQERAHARGRRGDAHIWIATEGPVRYRDEEGWHQIP